MKYWKLFSKEQKKQLLVILLFRLVVLSLLVLASAVMIYDIGVKHYIAIMFLGMIALQNVKSIKDTLDNIKRKGDDLIEKI